MGDRERQRPDANLDARGHQQLWVDEAGDRVSAWVRRTVEAHEVALVALSAGVAVGPQTRLAVGWERGALGAELDPRVGWDVAEQASEVPRESLGAGLVMTWRPGHP